MNLLNLKKLSAAKFLALGYFLVIFAGAVLLTLPISSKAGTWTPFLDALFTATSATCVTGLVVVDTFLHWSIFGQLVVLSLIQIGGLGIMTILTMAMILLGRNVGLYQRQLIMQSAGNLNIGGSVALILRIIKGTALIEGIGAVLLSIRFCQDFGAVTGIYYGIFHSVSAFCNAGFDLMGRYGAFSSLVPYADDPLVTFTIMGLIVLGGLGFLVWSDLIKCRFHFKRFTLHTKIALLATSLLILVPACLFLILERDRLFAGVPLPQAILRSLFTAVTPRTAGFNTVDMAGMSSGSYLLTIVLMFIGGNSGSTAGGIKITTFAVLLFATIAGARKNNSITFGGRELSDALVREASATCSAYVMMAIGGALVLTIADPAMTLTQIVLEVVSAIATVGLTAGITPSLSGFSHAALILLMYAGRLGVMTFALAVGQRKQNPALRRPSDRILIG